MSAASAFTVTVNYATSNGTATAGVDYTARSGTLTFGPGATSASFTVPITNDATIEVTETVNLTLSSPTNATLGTPNPATLAILDEDGAPPPTDEFYTYNKLGNLTSKTGKGSYSYPATGSAHPHAVTSTSDGQTYVYDANGNMTSTGGLISTYDAENRPTHLSRVSGTEDAAYDADGERVTRTFGFTTTVYLGGLWEEDVVGGASVGTRSLYTFNGVMVAQRDAMGVVYLHGDHLGSISVTTGAGGAKLSSQEYDPWGKVRPGSSIGQTALNYTGQRLDTTGLLYYHARYYDPNLGRFISADPVVPSSASGSMDGVALKPLTVDFHEPGFVSSLSGENQQSFWFQMSDRERQQAGIPWGPANPQALNRYSYVLNNPLRSTDPTGHLALNREQALALQEILERQGGVLDILEAQRNREKLGIGLIVALFSGEYLVVLVPPLALQRRERSF